jgi:hypothetical protein
VLEPRSWIGILSHPWENAYAGDVVSCFPSIARNASNFLIFSQS